MVENIIRYINIFFMYYMFIYACIFFISVVYSVINLNDFNDRKRYMSVLNIKNKINYIPISIIVPAYNEEDGIIECIESLLSLEYPYFEIIVVNDGSKDSTLDKVIGKYGVKRVVKPIRKLIKTKRELSIYEGYVKERKITLIDKENGGKADALNLGINASSFPLFVSLDADSVLEEDSLTNIIVPFMENDTTIAVGGNVKVSNGFVFRNGKVVKKSLSKKYIVNMQRIEYYRAFLAARILFNRFNGNLIISGAFGLFKKEAVINVGGYSSNTIGEDMELVVKLHSFYRKNKLKYTIQYVPQAVCYSQVPNTLRELGIQRRRWHIGLIDSLSSHRYVLMNPSYGVVGSFSYMYYLIYEMLSCLIEVIGFAFVLISYILGFINLKFLLMYSALYIGHGMIVSMSCVFIEKFNFNSTTSNKEIIRLLFFSIVEAFGYRQAVTIFRIRGVLTYRKNKGRWGKITRLRRKNN